jgi:hypothetical protein
MKFDAAFKTSKMGAANVTAGLAFCHETARRAVKRQSETPTLTPSVHDTYGYV